MKALIIAGVFFGYVLMTLFVLGLCKAAATSENYQNESDPR